MPDRSALEQLADDLESQIDDAPPTTNEVAARERAARRLGLLLVATPKPLHQTPLQLRRWGMVVAASLFIAGGVIWCRTRAAPTNVVAATPDFWGNARLTKSVTIHGADELPSLSEPPRTEHGLTHEEFLTRALLVYRLHLAELREAEGKNHASGSDGYSLNVLRFPTEAIPGQASGQSQGSLNRNEVQRELDANTVRQPDEPLR